MTSAKRKPAPEGETAAETASVTVAAPTVDNPENERAMSIVTYAESFMVANASDSAKGQEARARINAQIATLTEKRMSLTRPLDALKKQWMEFFAGPITKLESAKAILDRKLIAYENEQEGARRAEQRRLDKIAEDERRRLQTIADEAKRKADAEAERLRKEATDLEAAGNAEAAAKLAAKAGRVEDKAEAKAGEFELRALSVVAPIVQADTAKVAGSLFREIPDWEITDTNGINAAFKCDDLVKIGKIVQSLKLDAPAVVGPGLKVTMKKILASRKS